MTKKIFTESIISPKEKKVRFCVNASACKLCCVAVLWPKPIQCWTLSIFQNIRPLDRFSSLSGCLPVLCAFFCRNDCPCINKRAKRLLRCVHWQVWSGTVLISLKLCGCYKETPIRLNILHCLLSVFHSYFFNANWRYLPDRICTC